MTKTQKTRCPDRKRSKENEKDKHDPQGPPVNFGDKLTADHVIFSKEDASHDLKRYLLTVLDRATGWLEGYPCPSKDTAHTEMSLRDFAGSIVPKLLYTDNSGQFIEAAKRLKWLHDCSTDNRPATNGTIERANRNILEGLRSALCESGLEHKLWSQAVVCWCQLLQHHEKAG